MSLYFFILIKLDYNRKLYFFFLKDHAKNVKEIKTINTANKMQIVHNYELSNINLKKYKEPDVFNKADNFFYTKFIFF